MTDLHIALLSATSTAEDEPRVRRLLARVTEHRLAPVLDGLDLPAGEWCIRRLDVPLPLTDRQADGTVELAWAQALAAALREALKVGSDAGVLHYRRPTAALTDLLAALATGRTERVWAWRQLGLLQAGDPDPAGMPVAAALTALRRRPAEALPALIAAGRTVGIAALHRLLGPAGWNDLARLVVASRGGDSALAIPPDEAMVDSGPRFTAWSPGSSAGVRADPADMPLTARRLAAAIAGRSVLGQAATRSRLRPDQVTAWAWAALAAAEVEPALFVRSTVRLVLAQLAAGYRRGTTARPSDIGSRSQPVSGTESPDSDAAKSAEQQAMQQPADATFEKSSDQTSDKLIAQPNRRPDEHGDRLIDDPAAPEPQQPPAEYGWPTDWAGLPFLLNTAEPEQWLADEVLAGRPLFWTVYQLGRRLIPAIGPTDPALFALAGLVPAPAGLDEPTPAESDRLAGHAERWASVTAARLDEPDAVDPMELVQELAARPGVVFAEPGWIEIHLALDGVRLDVRRAGLDVDPGWLRWLAAVVRFVYE
ncbi:MAG TPA: hypothetical protein VJ851_13750 [Jatrophihabitans sp.]|nr:hypothetical protein [Jatrophihabitans sp.]